MAETVPPGRKRFHVISAERLQQEVLIAGSREQFSLASDQFMEAARIPGDQMKCYYEFCVRPAMSTITASLLRKSENFPTSIFGGPPIKLSSSRPITVQL
ncbi:MAG TPA: hypothetical protein VIS96_06240 [Terrimicrobiaceae bacterium]